MDAVSRKYFTSETSWLWDIDFGMLNTENTSHIYLLGKYADDLYVRFSYTDVPPEKLSAYESISKGVDAAVRDGVTQAYTITCFSDKGKFLSLVNTL